MQAVFAAEPVAEFQTFLNQRGCDVGTADGQWGKATTRGADEFAALSGIAITRPVTADLLVSLASSDSKCLSRNFLERFVPTDVLDGVVGARAQGWQCPPNTIDLNEILGLKSVPAIKGLTSNFNNSGEIAGYREMGVMASSLSGFAVRAYINDDDELKRLLIGKLAEWANAGAFLKTKDCSPQANKGCNAEWKDPQGNDVAEWKDYAAVHEATGGISRAYYALLADFDTSGLSTKHKAITRWLEQFDKRVPLNDDIYFGSGLNFSWARLTSQTHQNKPLEFIERLRTMVTGLEANVLDDGSLKDRTTRGARALFYHFAALEEVLFSLEILKANGIDAYPQYAERLHKAVKLFLDAYDDPSAIYPWAQVNLGSPGDYRVQEFGAATDKLRFASFASSWPYIYALRFPDGENTARIAGLFKRIGQLHDQDSYAGIGLQCLYMASLPQVTGWDLADQYPVTEAMASLPKFTFTATAVETEEADDRLLAYTVRVAGARIGDKPTFLKPLRIYARFPYGNASEISSASRLSLNIFRREFREVASRAADYLSCGAQAALTDDNSHDQMVTLQYSSDPMINGCVLSKMSPADSARVLALMDATRDLAVAAGDPGADLVKIYDEVASKPFR